MVMSLPPMILPDDSPRVRSRDPLESHRAADKSGGRRTPQKLAVEAALEAAGRPITSDEVYRLARRMGLYCTEQRVRTILAEHAKGNEHAKQGKYGSEFVAVAGGTSVNGNDARLWALAGES